MANSRTVAVQLAITGIRENTAALRGMGAAGEAALQQLASNSNRATVALEKLDNSFAGVQRVSRGVSFQNLGYQVNDFAVQVQSGTSAVVAFSQQFSQFAGGLGPQGALVGAVIAVGGALASQLIPGLQKSGDAAGAAAGPLEAYAAGLNKAKSAADSAAESISKLTTKQLAQFEASSQRQKLSGAGIAGFAEGLPLEDSQLENATPPAVTSAIANERRRRQEERGYSYSDVMASRSDLRGDQLKAAQEGAQKATDDLLKSLQAQDAAQERASAKADQAAAAQKRAAAAAASHAASVKNLRDRFDEEAAASARLVEAIGEGAYAQKLANIEHDKQRSILEASKTAKGEDLEYLKKRAELIAGNQRVAASIGRALPAIEQKGELQSPAVRERLSMDRLGEQQPDIDRDRLQATQQFADRQADILIEPWQNLATDVAQISTDIFDDFLAKGKVSFGDLATGFGDTIRTSISGTLGNLASLPLQQAVGQIATRSLQPGQSLGGSLTQFAKDNPYATSIGLGAAGGYAVGSVYSQAAGLKPGNQASTGGAIGGALGAGVGMYYGGPAGAAVGGAVGSAAGSAIGGLFGGQNDLGNDRSNQTYNSRRGKIVYGDDSFSPENRNITGGVLGEIGQLQEALAGLGARFKNFNIEIGAGNKTGITVDGKKYETAQEALGASIGKILGKTTGLSATEQTVLKNTKGGTAQEVLSDVGFAKTFDELTDGGNDFDKALRGLNETVALASFRAKQLGLDTVALAAAQAREQQEIARQRDQAGRGVLSQIASARGDDSLPTALFGLETNMRELAKAAADANIPLEQVTQAHEASAQRLIAADVELRRQRDQSTRGVYSQIAAAANDSSLNTALFGLETQMRELGKAAADASIPLQLVTDAHLRAAEELTRQRDQATRGVYSQIAAARGDESLGTALFGLQTQMNELAKAAKDANAPLELVTQAHQTAAQKLIETYDNAIRDLQKRQTDLDQQLVGANRSAFASIDQFIEPLKQATGAFGIGQGVFSPQAQAQGGLDEFRKVLEQAQAGDTGALSSIVGIGQQALQAQRSAFASGPEFAAAFKEINKGLLETQGALEEKRLQLAQSAIDVGRENVDEVIRMRVEIVRELQEQREQNRRDIALAIERRAA